MFLIIPCETRFPQTKALIPSPISSTAAVVGLWATADNHISRRLLTNKCRNNIVVNAEAKVKIQA